MAVISKDSRSTTDDPLLPWLSSVKKALDDLNSNNDFESRAHLDDLLENCIMNFKNDDRYRNDIRFLKIWILYADAIQDFKNVLTIMEERKICITKSLLYISYAIFLELKGKLVEADGVYRMGISRNAEPLEELKEMHSKFLNRMSEIVNFDPLQKVDVNESDQLKNNVINPWSMPTINNLLKKIKSQMIKCNGYYISTKDYPGKVSLSSIRANSKNNIIALGGEKYQIKGLSGVGGFAQVYKAYVNSNPDEVVVLKIQKPAFPWEYYMYSQLDKRISNEERSSFAFSHKAHIYADYSILVCDYLAHGTLNDAINSSLVVGQNMEEVLCIYYCVEMLHMLETLHSVGIIHGDFKPDNLLMRYAREDLTEDGFRSRTGPWHDQGLCLIDWGRGIDLQLFPDGTEFMGDCRTSGFRCVEMHEQRPWKFQVDTYGLCVIVHMMLHGIYMTIEKKVSSDGSYFYQPKSTLKRYCFLIVAYLFCIRGVDIGLESSFSSNLKMVQDFKRYWNGELWKNLFTRLLNFNLSDDHLKLLQSLRESFENYLTSNPKLIKKLTELLRKQKASLCS